MITTIDGAGRIVVPKAIRDEMKLTAGRLVDVAYVDGRIEIELAPARVDADLSEPLPRLRAAEPLPPLSDDEIRATVEATRR
ncbi:MAG: AbrB/MazE/SpoVT family DNA-binding domain-containing protein [Nocardioides sp.]|uniref:AbrB/MazE/SpoVT family DNA-binding domain-containing protein n=1 Tax=Nocardioides sp. TaxID=35761 RepID=UPI0039E665BA